MSPHHPTDDDAERIDATPGPAVSRRVLLAALSATGVGAAASLAGPGSALAQRTDHPEQSEGRQRFEELDRDPSDRLIEQDAATRGVVSDGPSAHVTKHLDVAGRGERLLSGGTTDVWAHGNHAYIGTFNSPCGTGEGFGEGALVDDRLGPGIPVFDVANRNDPDYVGNIPSVEGSRTNDVKVEAMGAGDVLVHSNEPCDGGPGGFEIYTVDDPESPTHQASVRIDELNAISDALFDGVTDVGVHNLFLFQRHGRDYVAAVAESVFHNFRVYDITDPSSPRRVAAWGAEEIFDPGVGDAEDFDEDVTRVLLAVLWLLDGFGTSQNRFLHDITVSADGTRAYLANWDAGLVLMDISDPTSPELVSVALDPTAGDGEVNSHQAWPSEDGSVVVETEEDFNQFALSFSITEGPNAGEYPAIEGAFTEPIADRPDRTLAGPTTYVGLACEADSVPPAPTGDHIAVIQRGACRFDRKAQHVIDKGYAGMVVFNSPGNDSVIVMGGESRAIPGLFVGHSTGLAIFDVASADDLSIGDSGAAIEAVVEPERWGNVRIWDYSDESNPVLASEFDTRCSADPAAEECDPRGTYTVHNAIIENEKAYLSWYSDGVLILDISDPYDPVETARYSPGGEDFEDQNAGIQDVWGVYKIPEEPWIYASDRNGGLYVLKEYGSGAENRQDRDRQ